MTNEQVAQLIGLLRPVLVEFAAKVRQEVLDEVAAAVPRLIGGRVVSIPVTGGEYGVVKDDDPATTVYAVAVIDMTGVALGDRVLVVHSPPSAEFVIGRMPT